MYKYDPIKVKIARDVILSVDKTYGTGSLMFLGDSPKLDIEVIPSGCISLDWALGIGGFPRGRIIEVYGPESSGKCQDEKAYILTSKGYKTVSEIFEENDLPLFTSHKEMPKVYELVNGEGARENTSYFVYNGVKPLYEITTRTGFKFKRTYKHPLLTLSRFGNIIWKWAGQIEPRDYIVRLKDQTQSFGEGFIEKDKAYALGLFIADGTFGKENLVLTNDDPTIKNFIENKLCGVLEIDHYRKYDNNGKGSFNYQFTGVNKFYEQWGLKPGIAKDKFIPLWIRELTKEGLVSFLQGYMDCECYISEQGLEVTSASYDLLYQVKLILSQFGITTFLGENGVIKGYEENDYCRLTISGQDFERYIIEIGTRSQYRKSQIEEFVNRGITQLQTNHNLVSRKV